MNEDARMLKGLSAVFLVFLLSFPALAQKSGDGCKLGDTTKLFIAKDGKKYLAKLPKGTDLILKGNHGERTMVKTTSGKLGFVKATWLRQTCAYSKAAPVAAVKPKAAPVNAPGAVETAAALQSTAAAAYASSWEAAHTGFWHVFVDIIR